MRRVPELDALRGLAALAIVVFHLSPKGFFFGWVGIHLFFVLSGYLITGIILKYKGRKHFTLNFYARRSLRIWPIYYVALAVVVAMNLALPHRFPWGWLPYYLTYTQNIPYYWGVKPPHAHPALLHTWTLAIEEQFYLLWPPLVSWSGRRFLIPLAAGVVGLSYWARARGFDASLLLSQSDGFALGGLLAFLFDDPERAGRNRRRLVGLFWASSGAGVLYELSGVWSHGDLIYLRPPYPDDPGPSIFFINLFFFGLVGVVIFHAGTPSLAFLRDRRLCFLGLISYGIYLYHPILFYAADAVAGRMGYPHNRAVEWLMAPVCISVAALSWHFIEKPILGLKDRFSYGEEPHTVTQTSHKGHGEHGGGRHLCR